MPVLIAALNGEPSATFENIFVEEIPGVRERFAQIQGNFGAY